jgi:release factor glutamine methyltransferase
MSAVAGERVWTVLELLRWTTGHFERHGLATPRLDAECLLAHALGTSRLGLYVDFEKPVDPEERGAFRNLVRRRSDDRVPVAQLTGRKEFWSIDLEITPDVLVPRPETETLVQLVVDRPGVSDRDLKVLDLGTGSGAVAVALLKELPKARVTATDVSEEALAVARRNAESHGVADRIRLVAGDGFEPVSGERFDLVVSNPPYVAEADAASLQPELRHEPRAALFAGPDGLAVLRRIASGVRRRLEADGFVAVEVGAGQSALVGAAFEAAGLSEVTVHPDSEGRPRVVSGVNGAGAPADGARGGE